MDMRDPFGRNIDYLRVSVTDRCNLRCQYCMPPSGVQLIAHEDILSYEDITAFVKAAVGMGIRKVRLTGGEPLVRKGVVSLVRMLAAIDGVDDLAMSTNGTLLSRFATPLREAGLQRVNISLDSVRPEQYAAVTCGGELQDALDGIDAASAAGLEPVKINCVVVESSNEPDAQAVAAYARERRLQIRFIRRMSLTAGEFYGVEGGDGGKCHRCSRLRLSSDGWLRPCLFSDIKVNIRGRAPEAAIREALELKPRSGSVSLQNRMSRVGG